MPESSKGDIIHIVINILTSVQIQSCCEPYEGSQSLYATTPQEEIDQIVLEAISRPTSY